MSTDYSEDRLIQKSAAELLENELGWTSVYTYDNEVLGTDGTLGRNSYHEVLLGARFRNALRKLNPWISDKQIIEATERMTERMSSQTLMQINEQKYQYIRDGIPVTRVKPDGTSEALQDPITTEKISGGIRYRVKLSDAMLKMAGPAKLSHQFLRLYFSALPGSSGRSGTARWQITADGGSMPEQKVTFRVLPPLKMPSSPLKQFKASITMRYSVIGAPSPEIAAKLADFWPGLSASPVPTMLHTYCRELKDPRYEGWVSLPSQAGMPAFRPLEFERLVRTGKLLDKYPHTELVPPYTNRALSPAYMHEDPEGVFAKYLKDGVELYRKSYPTAKYIFWNFEPGVKFTSAYDRKRFCEKLKLPRTLSAEEIRRSHHAEWKKFAFDQSTETIRLVSAAFRKYWPEVKLMLCGGNLRTEQPDMRDQYCATDPRDYDRYVDWHVPMSYIQTVAFFDQSAATVKYTKKPVLILVDPNEIRKDFYHAILDLRYRLILKRACDRLGGQS